MKKYNTYGEIDNKFENAGRSSVIEKNPEIKEKID